MNDATKTLSDEVKAERDRCARIVSAARMGDIDTDFRTLLHFIEIGDTMQFNATAHEYEHDSQRKDREMYLSSISEVNHG